eukprot:CAMPEP_0115090134 /NCGR_PEP_ID=MMETSP0227-20121206/25206_1 /TAXON_ID=89957 /ORGANISM="Polarella glacialis, Strain CCMP 1383" /LENGTH=93 /DNA_ID=CAMNT_0002481137 /DNA_START=54 /DNA_END=332 /DNA_ORIENTATION=+
MTNFADCVLEACLREPAFIKALIAEASASKADLPDEVAKARDAADEKLAASCEVMEAHGISSGSIILDWALGYQNRRRPPREDEEEEEKEHEE